MPRVSAEIFSDKYLGRFRSYLALAERRIEAAALIATDRAAQSAKRQIRAEMSGAGLGKLGNAIDAGSDMQKGGRVHRSGKGFSASGWVFVRSKSERTLGAIEAYTGSGETLIAPVRGRWLWIPTDEIQRIGGTGAGKRRLTPGNWSKYGMDQKIGPLVMVKSVNGYPLYVVKNATVSATGARRSAKALNKRGYAGRGRVEKEFIVAFVGIPRTSRTARVNITTIMKRVQADLPRLFSEALEGTF